MRKEAISLRSQFKGNFYAFMHLLSLMDEGENHGSSLLHDGLKVTFLNYRFNPKRAESNYHKAVASGIAACLPRRGYFEQKLSLQVHKVLISTHGFDPGEEIKIITKRKRKSAGMSSSQKKRSVFYKFKGRGRCLFKEILYSSSFLFVRLVVSAVYLFWGAKSAVPHNLRSALHLKRCHLRRSTLFREGV